MKTQTARGKRVPSTSNESTDFSFSTGALYADKDEYVAKHRVFTIVKIVFQEGAGYEGTDRWAVHILPGDGDSDEIVTLQANEKRDAELQAAAAHIEKAGRIRNVKLVKFGKAYYFRSASETKVSLSY